MSQDRRAASWSCHRHLDHGRRVSPQHRDLDISHVAASWPGCRRQVRGIGLVGGGLALLASALTLAVAVPWLASKHIHVDIFSHNVGVVLLGGIAAMTIYAVVGVGVGSLIRNQMAAVASPSGGCWSLRIFSSASPTRSADGRPWRAAAALDRQFPNGRLATDVGRGVLFVAYGVAFAAARHQIHHEARRRAIKDRG
jgi:hypothetical protein